MIYPPHDMSIKKVFELEEQIVQTFKERERLVPWLTFPDGCEVMFTPTYIVNVRYIVRKKGGGDVLASVYLDLFGLAGFYPDGPYWEVYSMSSGDTWRYGIDDTKGVEEKVAEILDKGE